MKLLVAIPNESTLPKSGCILVGTFAVKMPKSRCSQHFLSLLTPSIILSCGYFEIYIFFQAHSLLSKINFLTLLIMGLFAIQA